MGRRLGVFLSSLLERRDGGAAAAARRAGITESTINQIARGDIECPPRRRLEGIARALGVSVESVIRAAERDGCNYD